MTAQSGMRWIPHALAWGTVPAVAAVLSTLVAVAALTAPAPALAFDNDYSTWNGGATGGRRYYRDVAEDDYDTTYGEYDRDYRHNDASCAKRSWKERWRDRKRGCYSITHVDPQKKQRRDVFRTISAAIAHTRPGGTVLIEPGSYDETVRITWPIQLRANVPPGSEEESDQVRLITPADKPCAVIDVKEDEKVILRDLWFQPAASSVARDCVVHDGGKLTIESGRIEANDRAHGIHLRGTSASITNAKILNADTGVAVGTARESSYRRPRPIGERNYTLTKNEIVGNRKGIGIDADNVLVTLKENEVRRNTRAGLLATKGQVVASRNDFSRNGRDGVVIVYPREITLTGNRISDNDRFGLHMPFSQDVQIASNCIFGNLDGNIKPKPKHMKERRRGFFGRLIHGEEPTDEIDGNCMWWEMKDFQDDSWDEDGEEYFPGSFDDDEGFAPFDLDGDNDRGYEDDSYEDSRSYSSRRTVRRTRYAGSRTAP